MNDYDAQAMVWQREKLRRVFTGLAVGLAVFGAVGTVTSVWSNPFFRRMTPIGEWELSATFLMGLFAGVTAGFWTDACRLKRPGGGGLIGFLGIACPTCNKVLMLLFGAPALMSWFDPLRPWMAAAGLVGMGWSAWSAASAFQPHGGARQRPRRHCTGDIE